jgi:transposase
MATVLEECTAEEQRCVVCFLWAKGLNAKDIRKEMFLVYGGKGLSHKAVHNWVEKFSQGHSKVSDDARPGRHVAQVAETTIKRLLCWRFDALVKRWDKCIEVGGGHVKK